jgi:nitric oxide reductase subunit B
MNARSRIMVVSPLWLQVAILTFVTGFAILGVLAYLITAEHPPIPQRVLRPDSTVLFTGEDIMAGQHLFQKYGLMQFGTIFGHGAYLGPDFTAKYLHQAGTSMLQFYGAAGMMPAEAAARVEREFKRSAYDSRTGDLPFSDGQVYAFEWIDQYDWAWFGPPSQQSGLRRPTLTDPAEVRRLTAYFAWAAWAAAATRPGAV